MANIFIRVDKPIFSQFTTLKAGFTTSIISKAGLYFVKFIELITKVLWIKVQSN